MAAFSSLGLGLLIGGLAGGGAAALNARSRAKKAAEQAALQAQSQAQAPAPTQAAQAVAATNPPDATKETSEAYKAGQAASVRVRRRIPGGGFTGGMAGKVSRSQLGIAAGYTPRTLVGG